MIDEKEQVATELTDLRQKTGGKVGGDSPKMGVSGGVSSEEVTFLKAKNAALQKSLQSKYT